MFIRYDRYERFRQNTVQQAVPSEAPPPEPPRPAAIAPMPGRQTTAWPENARVREKGFLMALKKNVLIKGCNSTFLYLSVM